MSKVNPYKTVAAYIDAQPEKIKEMLLELKTCIIEVVPNTEELFNYHIPAYTLKAGGKREAQIMISANKNSVGFYPHPTTIEKFDKDLVSYKTGKGSVQFPLDRPIPKDLVLKMIKYRLTLLTK